MFKKVKMLQELGFKKDVTREIVVKLQEKGTKAAAYILERMETNTHYMVLVSETQFTVVSQYKVFKKEFEVLAKMLGLKYIEAGKVADNAGCWIDWIGCQNADGTEQEIEEVEEGKYQLL